MNIASDSFMCVLWKILDSDGMGSGKGVWRAGKIESSA